jgi:hypothetical protein
MMLSGVKSSIEFSLKKCKEIKAFIHNLPINSLPLFDLSHASGRKHFAIKTQTPLAASGKSSRQAKHEPFHFQLGVTFPHSLKPLMAANDSTLFVQGNRTSANCQENTNYIYLFGFGHDGILQTPCCSVDMRLY